MYVSFDVYVAQYRALSQAVVKPSVSHVWASELHGHASVSTSYQTFQVYEESGNWVAVVRNKAFAGGDASVEQEKVCASREEAATWAAKWVCEVVN